MANINDILAIKGRTMITIAPEASMYDAAVLMTQRGIGSLLVVEDGQLVGMITERDFLTRLVSQQRDPESTTVGELMERDVFCCRPHTELEEAKSVMKHRLVRHLPVMNEDEQLVGLISIGDLNAYQTEYHERTIYLMEEYIHGVR
jgi:CBS domain-containing protein